MLSMISSLFAKKKEVEALERARNHIDKGGWVQQRYSLTSAGSETCIAFGSQFCAHGAIARAMYDMGCDHGAERNRLENYCIDALFAATEQPMIGYSHYTTIHEWNDTPGRTKEEVLAAFDRAIEMVKQCG